ncbi:MAG: MmcQ/YjbR family DNA-binding protein [Chthoniobacterales bacterium]
MASWLALSLPEAVEGEHMNQPDFRVRNRIFATLWPNQNRGVVKLTSDQQKMLTASASAIFSPVPGGGDAEDRRM